VSLTLTTRPTIVDSFIPRSLVADIALVIGGTALTAAAAQLVIPTSPVPFTGQTFAVLLVGAASMFLYLLVGAAGLPVFTEGKSGIFDQTGALTATFGYLAGFVLAASLVGFLAERGWAKSSLGVISAFVLGNAVIYALGLPWLQFALKASWADTIAWGFTPFIVGDLLKLIAAAFVLPGAYLLVKKVKG
jgi:biotin transport system substrate-specific component